ncbi:MAG: hypothetical protein ACOX4L_04070 [Bacillota bacterium]
MNDRFIKGVIAGTIASIAKNIPDLLLHNVFMITEKSFWDYTSIIASGKHPQGLFEHAYSFFFEIIFSIFLGLTYTYLIPYFKTNYNLLRGAIYGGIVWFAIRTWVVSFQISPLLQEGRNTMIVNSLLSILFGIILEWIIQLLIKKNQHEDVIS